MDPSSFISSFTNRNKRKAEIYGRFGATPPDFDKYARLARNHREIANNIKNIREPMPAHVKRSAIKKSPAFGKFIKSSPSALQAKYNQAIRAVAPKRGYSGPSQSSGFVKARKRVRPKQVRKLKTGCQVEQETSGTITASNVAFVGHTTHPVEVIRNEAWRSLMTRLMLSAGCYIQAQELVLNEVVVGDKITIAYRLIQDTSPTTLDYPVAGSISLQDLVTWFSDPTRPWMVPTSQTDQVQFLWVKFIPLEAATNPVLMMSYIHLEGARVTLTAKSHLKFQNRTPAGTDQNEQNVSNVPIAGKLFAGTGTGAQYGRINGSNFIANSVYGVIAGTSSAMSGLDTVPDITNFKRVKYTGKAKLDPGDLKTSTLSATLSGDFSSIIGASAQSGLSGSGTFQLLKKSGKYQFFVYERMIDMHDAGEVDMLLAYELKLNMHTVFKSGTARFGIIRADKEYTVNF